MRREGKQERKTIGFGFGLELRKDIILGSAGSFHTVYKLMGRKESFLKDNDFFPRVTNANTQTYPHTVQSTYEIFLDVLSPYN